MVWGWEAVRAVWTVGRGGVGGRGTSLMVPTGMVTFLSPEIVGSPTPSVQAAAPPGALVAGHQAAIDEVVAAHGQVSPVVQGEGDILVAAFSRASDAVAAAVEVQRALAHGMPGLAVRMAVHAGAGQRRDGFDGVGYAATRCAWLRECGRPSQSCCRTSPRAWWPINFLSAPRFATSACIRCAFWRVPSGCGSW